MEKMKCLACSYTLKDLRLIYVELNSDNAGKKGNVNAKKSERISNREEFCLCFSSLGL
eukprot:c13323_g1_i1 orf=243-416(+)